MAISSLSFKGKNRVMVANEYIEEYKRRKKKGCIVKLDLEKANEKTASDFWTLCWLGRVQIQVEKMDIWSLSSS